MRHRWAGRKLGRSSSHRRALMRTMVTDLLENERMVTTLPKAKEVRSVAEKMITLGKKESLHARRQALSFLRKKSVVHKLFDSLGPRFADRAGGYTRIMKLGYRRGDAAEVAVLELVTEEVEPKPKKKSRRKVAAAVPPVTGAPEKEPETGEVAVEDKVEAEAAAELAESGAKTEETAPEVEEAAQGDVAEDSADDKEK